MYAIREESPVTLVYYQSAQGFTGVDSAVVEVLFPSGNVRTVNYSINVRPQPMTP